MKGFVFTLDAIFSVVFAAAAISALVYVSYSGYIPPTIQSSEASSVGAALVSANLKGLGQLSPLYGAGTTGTWPQYGADEGFSFGSAYGPTGPYLLYTYQASTNIIPAPVASGGYVAFAAGSQLYEINATTGQAIKNYPMQSSSAMSASPVFYRSLLIYANTSGYVGAVSTSNGLAKAWKTSIAGYSRMTTPLAMEGGYLVFGVKNSSGYGVVYFLDPSNGTIMEKDPTLVGGNGPLVSWIAHHKGGYYIGTASGKSFNGVFLGEAVNVSQYPSNSFSSYGSFAVVDNKGTASMYANLTAYYSRTLGIFNITSVPYYGYAHRSTFAGNALFNTTPSIGGNMTYLLYNGIYFQAFRQGGMVFNVTLPSVTPLWYNYSDIALAYGNAYLAEGKNLYAFGPGVSAPRNTSLLAALAGLYLSGRGSLADYVLFKSYGTGSVGVFINGSYAPSLHVAKFNGIDSYIAIPANPKLSPEAGVSGAMSLCGWYRINSMIGYNGLLFKGTQAPSSGSGAEFALDVGGAGRGFEIYNPAGSVAASYNTPFAANAVGNWYSFCLAYNESATSYYLNGTGYSGTVNVGVVPLTGTGAIVIGAGKSGYSNVSVANLQLYNSVLSASRVSAIYSSGMYAEPPNFSGLVGWWPLLGDGNDYGGAGHVGFPNNMSYTNSNSLPAGLRRAVQVDRSAIPLQLTNNGVSMTYNVSVIVWNG